MAAVLALATAGGHFIQLTRLKMAFEGYEMVYVSTKHSFASFVQGDKFYCVPGASRRNKLMILYCFLKVLIIFLKVRPKVIITTGAAVGVCGVVVGWLFRKKTLFVDSIANAEMLSMSARLSSKFATKVYTQWPDLTSDKVVYKGNVFA